MAPLLLFFLTSTWLRVLSDSSFCSGRNDGNYPYLSNCSKFYVCSGEITHVNECATNTFWNQPLLRCEHECNQAHPDVHLETTLAPEQPTVTTTEHILHTTVELSGKSAAGGECGLQKILTIQDQAITGCPVIMEKNVISRIHCLNKCVGQNSCNCIIYYKSNNTCSLLNCYGSSSNNVSDIAAVSLCFL